jgi:hypothetical protein
MPALLAIRGQRATGCRAIFLPITDVGIRPHAARLTIRTQAVNIKSTMLAGA